MAEFSTDTEKTQVPAGTEEVYEKFVETPQGIPAEPTLDVGPATEFLGKTPEDLPFFQEVPDDEIPPGFMGLSEFNKIRRASKVKGPGSDAKMAMIWGMADQLGMKPHEVANRFEELSDEIMHRDRATAASLAMTAAIPFALAAPVAAPIIGGHIGAALATLGVKPISMIAGIAGFEMLPRIQNMLVKYFEDGKFQPSAMGDKWSVSRFVPGEASNEEKAMAELFDILNDSIGAVFAGAATKFGRSSWAKLTKEIIAEIRAPKEIHIDATVLKQVIAENPKEWPAFLREMKESFGLEAADINHAVQNGYAISVPTHLVTFLVDRPWWETLKRGIGLDPYKRMGGVYRETPLTQIEGPQGKLEGTQGAGVTPMEPLPRDRLIDTIAEAMKQVESGGDYSIVSRDGGKGAYQFTGTWPSWSAAYAAEKGLGNQPLPFTPENQDAVAKWKIGQYLDKGWTLEQVAAAWNGGEGVVPNDRWKTMVGRNDAGVRYDVPHHVSKVVDAFNKISGGAVVPSSPGARKPSTFTRADLVESMERVQLPFEQKQGFLELLDAVAESWALTNKLTPDHFYEHLFAGLKVVEDSEALKDFVLKQTERDRLRNMEVQPGKTQAMVDDEQVRLMRETMRFAKPPSTPIEQAKVEITENPAFKEWFGSSPVVDENRNPLVVYHTTDQDFDTFDLSKVGKNFGTDIGYKKGFFFSSDPKDLDITYFDLEREIGPSRVIPAYVSMQKPYHVKINNNQKIPDHWATTSDPDNYYDNTAKIINKKARLGKFDGIIVENIDTGKKLVIPFHPTQIKSIFNEGTFDPNNPNFLKQTQETIIKGAAQILDDLRGMIYLFEKAGTPNYDISTLFEEFLHVYAFHMLPEDVAVVNQWHGIAEDTPVTEWTTDQHENFAKAWLKFLYEGEAPSSKLRALFAKIRKWLVDLYHFISKLDVELTEPLRDVFRKIIARAERENNGVFRVRDEYELSQPPNVFFQKTVLEEEIPGLSNVMKYLTEEERGQLKRDNAARLMEIFQKLPSSEEMAAVAYSGRSKKGWYKNSAKAILDIFGIEDAPRFAKLLAAMSPQTSVEQNALNAIKTWVNWVNAGRPRDRESIVQIMGQSVPGQKGEKSVLDSWVNNSIRALSSIDPVSTELSGPKVSSFAKNLMDNVNDVTNDAWMANYVGISQELFAGKMTKGGQPGKGSGYLAMNAVVRKAAEVLTKKTGEQWTPSEIQETVWSWAKTLYEKRTVAGQDKTVQQILEMGGLTHEDIGNVPDFYGLFASKVYSKILKDAGYDIESVIQKSRAGDRGIDRLADQGIGPESPKGSSFSESTYKAHLRRAAKRLESLHEKRLKEKGKPKSRIFFQIDTRDEYDKLMAEASRRALAKVQEKRQKATERRENQWAKQAKQIVREDPLQALKEEIVKRGGMSHRELSADYGSETLAALNKKRPGLVSKKGKLPPDVIAADYGFEGLDDMIQTILDGPTMAEAVETQVEFMRQEQLAESESEALEDLLAIMDEEVKILSELTKTSTEKMTNIPAKDLKGIIRRNTGQVKVDEAKQVSEYHALKASLERQQRAARVAFNSGKVDGALKAKVQARATAQKLLEKRQANVLFKKLVRNIERMARDKKLPWDYAKQIQDILEPFGFKKRTETQEAKWEKEIRGRLGQDPKDLETFDEFLRRLESEGELVNIDPKAKRLIDKMNRVPITNVSDVQIIHDAVEHLYHLGTTKGKLLSQKQKRDLDTVCAFIGKNILSKAPKVKELWEVVRPSGTEKTLSERIRDHIKEWDAELLPAEFLIRMMDGFEENGPFWNHTKLPVEEAFEIKSKLMKQIEQAFKKAFGNIPEKKLREWAKKKESFPGFPMHLQMMTKQQMIMLVANSFHPDNIKALKAGYGLDDEQIHQVRQMLSPDEMQLVKDLIDIWKLTKKHLFDAHMTLTGRPLKEVEGVYFRLKFDPELSDTIAEKQAEQQAAEFFKDFFPRVNVQAGAAHERTGGSKAPLLQFGWIPGDLEETAHYGTHAVVVRDILKILKHPSVKNAIKQTYGEMYHHQLMQWLKRVANPNPPESPMKTDRMLNTIRKAQVTYVMFWRLSTALQQPLALMNTAGEVGTIPTLEAIAQFMNPVKLKYYWDFVNEKSQNMAQRSLSYDREIFETFKHFDPTHVDWYEQSVAVGQILTAFTDGVVARIGWVAAYNQAMSGKVKNISALDEEMAIRYADSVVIRTQASGSPKDRSSLMASNSASRKMFLTFFFSFLNNQYGFFRQHVSKFRNPNVEYGWLDFLKVVFLTWILQSMAQEIISKGSNVKRNDILTAPLKFPLSTLPGVRDMTSVVLDGYDYRGGLAGNLLNEMKRFMQTMIKPSGAHKEEKRILASLRLVGRLTGLPPDQAFIIAENLVNRRATSPWALIYRQRKGQKP